MKPQSEVKCSRVANVKTSKCKVVKSLKPLINFRFYLDIEKHNVLLKIESKIKELGGSIEFLLTKDVTHFITDRVLDNKDTPLNSPIASPRTSLSNLSETGSNVSLNNDSKGGNKIKSRADAMLQRARNLTTDTERQPPQSRSPSQVARRWGTPIWNTEYTLNFFEKVYNAVKEHFKGEFPAKSKEKPGNAKVLKGSYIKIEAFNKQYRPYYTILQSKWPGINLETYEHIGAFKYANDRKSAKSVKATQHTLPESKKSEDSTMTRKNRSTKHIRVQPSSRISSEKQCGFCEICRVEYDVLTVHLKTNEHVNFVKNDRNFLELDSLIKSSANVNNFLSINKTILNGNECEVFPKRSRRQTALNNRYIHHKSRSEPERIKDAVVELEKKSLSETNTLTRNTRQSFSQQSLSLTPAPMVNQRSSVNENKTQSNELVTAVVRSRRESVKKVNYAEPGEEDEENSNDAVFSDIQRKPIKPLKKSAVIIDESPDVKPKRPISTVMYKVVDTNMDNHTDRKEPLTVNNSEQPAPLIVKFKKVRQTELSILNGEAVNFMFPPKMSSDVPTDVDRHTTSESRADRSSDFLTSEKGPCTPKRKSSIVSMCTNDSCDSSSGKRKKNNNSFVTPASNNASQEKLSNSGRDRRGKRHQRRRFRCAPIQPRGRQRIKPEPVEPEEVFAATEAILSPPEDRMGEKAEEDTCNLESILKNELGKYKFAFERVPFSEPWYGVFSRQDECKEAVFEYYGNTVYRKLPYEMGPLPPLPENCGCFKSKSDGDRPIEGPSTLVGIDEDSTASESVENPAKSNQQSVDKRENSKEENKQSVKKKKSTNRMASLLSIDMPRKSPREHPSTLAILSCLLNRREEKPRKTLKSDGENLSVEPRSEQLKPPVFKEENSKEKIQVPKQIETEINPAVKTPVRESTNVQISPQIGESVKRLRRGAKLLESKRQQSDTPNDKSPTAKAKRSVGRPRRPYIFQKSTDSSEGDRPEHVDVNRLNRQIDLYLSMPPSRINFPDDENLPIVGRKNEIVDDFQYELDLGDLVFDGTAGNDAKNTFNNYMTKSGVNKLRLYKIFGANKKVKVNRTGWPKKRRVITRHINSTRIPFINELDNVNITNKIENVPNNELNIISQSPITPPETDVEEKNDCDVNSVTTLRDENTNLTFASDRADNSDMFTVSSDSLDTVLDVGSQIKSEVQKQIIASRKCKVNICNKLPQDVKIRKSSRICFRKDKSSFLPYKLKTIKVEQPDIEDESEAMSCSPLSITTVDRIKSSPAPLRQRSIKASPITVCPISPRRLRKPRGRWYRER